MIIDPVSKHLPDCSFPLIFRGDYEESPYGMAGSGFLVRDEARAFFVTAGHCLGKTDEEIKKSVNDLCAPLSSSTYDQIPFTEFSEVTATDIPPEELPGGEFDLVVLTVDMTDVRVRDNVLKRAAVLPPSGEWFGRLEQRLRKDREELSDKVLLKVKGFPTHGTESKVDYENRHLVTQGVILRARAEWEEAFPHTKKIHFVRDHCPISDFDGLSGSPVFAQVSSGPEESYTLAGMMIRASQYTGHFITVPWLVSAVKEAAK